MNKIENLEKFVILYDKYKNLLTEKQQLVFELYYFQDFSFAEIANQQNISRAAVHDSLEKTKKKLSFYEENIN